MLENVDKKLVEYISNNIFPIYEKDHSGHGMDHINYVINRSLKFALQFDDVDINKVYVIAAYHDLAHHIDKDNHELLSAYMFYEDEFMEGFFSDEERLIIKEAIEDHRASLDVEPRNIYGKIISSADRSTDIKSILERTHAYSLKHHPEYSVDEIVNRAYDHLLDKYGKCGYAKSYVNDSLFEDFKKEVDCLLNDKVYFKEKYLEINYKN